ncbi:DUF2934 domain-containing protein [Sorangium sp. So ce296]|uniref:DUF2934 domain-containing protein n=1 Tax=Sorangium sp. So ce296 TaxID=3133296 RepID=UPI003F605B5D
MSTFDDLVRQVAHSLWQSRGCPIGSDQDDWFTALSIVNGIVNARSEGPSAFFHCFTRSRNIDDAFETLRMMLDIGILLTPEQLTFYPSPRVTQSRLSMAFIPSHELYRHSLRFGPFALKMASYATLAGDFGASPVWYIPSFIKKDTGANMFEHGAEVAEGLAKTQQWIHDMRNDPLRADERHEPHRIMRLCLRLIYPTHYKDSTDIRDLYFLQREWRIIRRDSQLNRCIELNHAERNRLLKHNPSFFGADVSVWSESAGAMVAKPRVDATFKLDVSFADVVSEIIVPGSVTRRVKDELKPPVPIVEAERYEYGYHQ